MHRRKWRTAIVLAAVVAATLVSGGHAYASAPPNNSTWVQVTDADPADGFINVLPSDIQAGDCTQFGPIRGLLPEESSNVRMTVVAAGLYAVQWRSATMTSHTNNADVWWSSFEFYAADGTLVAKTDRGPGASMTRINVLYFRLITFQYLQVDPALMRRVAWVHWIGSC